MRSRLNVAPTLDYLNISLPKKCVSVLAEVIRVGGDSDGSITALAGEAGRCTSLYPERTASVTSEAFRLRTNQSHTTFKNFLYFYFFVFSFLTLFVGSVICIYYLI